MTGILRDGIPIEKGVALTKKFLDDNEGLIKKYLNLWMLYPDYYLDITQNPEDAKNFKLTAYQRISLRASMRYRYHFWTRSNPYIL